MSKKTTYTAITDVVEETFATKQAAIRFGEKTGEPFYVRTSGGAVVHDTRADAAEETQEAAEETVTASSGKGKSARQKDAKEDSKDEDVVVLNYRASGPKHFFKALTEPVLAKFKGSSRGRDFTVSVPTAEASQVVNVWGDALEALREWKKENAAYKRASTKTDAGRKLRYEMEQEFLSSFVKKALR